ncbi:MAG: hypothetical protein EOO05_01930 [Chitinophagaceae bacterium]|nr:MAG: hypothetical protein EOO05_01930 [Chitinophagaceae bacterium]
MKKSLLVLSACLLGFSAFSQTIDEVYTKYITTAGGAANGDKIKTMKITGTLTVQGMDLPLIQHIISGRGVKTDVEVMGSSVQFSYLDGAGWKINPYGGAPEATAMDESELADFRDQTAPVSPLFDSKKNGDKLELAGEETLPDGKAWKIKATSKDGRVTEYFVNSTSFDLVKSVSKRTVNGAEMNVEAGYGDYKLVEGVRLPFSLSTSGGPVNQAITIEKYEINVPVDEKIFAKP